MERTAWFCPACQKYHAPHVETCPGPVGVRPLPDITIPPIHPVVTSPWKPGPGDPPWTPYYPVVTSIGVVADPNTVIMSCVATTRAC